MKSLGTGINLFVGLLVLAYIGYISYQSHNIPHVVSEIALEPLGRFIVVVLIVMTAIGHKFYGVGGPTLGLLLAIAYMLTLIQVNNGNIEKFNVNKMGGSTQCGNYQSDDGYFNPDPYRPDDSMLASGMPDPLPENEKNFGSSPLGVYADSGVEHD